MVESLTCQLFFFLVSTTISLIFLLLFLAPSGYPRIVESPTLKAVEKDRNTVMLCSATGDPEPTVTWLKDYIPVDVADARLKVLPTGRYLSNGS